MPEAVAEREVTITRVFDAPRELVFSMWTNAKHLAAWWGPHGFTNPKCEADPRPGGKLLIHMRAPDGNLHPMGGVYDEVTPYSRIVFRSFVDLPDGTRAIESTNTVTFVEAGKKTRLILHARAAGFTDMPRHMLAGMEAGWATSLDTLAGAGRTQNGNKDAADQTAIRAIFGDATNAIWTDVAELGLQH